MSSRPPTPAGIDQAGHVAYFSSSPLGRNKADSALAGCTSSAISIPSSTASSNSLASSISRTSATNPRRFTYVGAVSQVDRRCNTIVVRKQINASGVMGPPVTVKTSRLRRHRHSKAERRVGLNNDVYADHAHRVYVLYRTRELRKLDLDYVYIGRIRAIRHLSNLRQSVFELVDQHEVPFDLVLRTHDIDAKISEVEVASMSCGDALYFCRSKGIYRVVARQKHEK